MRRDTTEASLLTPGFIALLDLFTSLVAAGIAYGGLIRRVSGEFLTIDVAFSIVLLVSGVLSSVPLMLVAISSIPVSLMEYLLGFLGLSALQVPYWLAPILIGAFRAGRGAYNVWFIIRGMGRLGRILDTIIVQAGILASITILGGSIILYIAEAGAPGSSVKSYMDALWLTLATITTVGYGDAVPVTGVGKVIAGMIMLVGIGLFTFFLSSLSAGLVKIVMAEEPISPIERRKRLIIEMIKHVEELRDDEYEALKKNLDLLYTIATADRRELLTLDLSPENLGIPKDLLSEKQEASTQT